MCVYACTCVFVLSCALCRNVLSKLTMCTAADTITHVAVLYDVSVPSIKALNKMVTNDIWTRQTLKIPKKIHKNNRNAKSGESSSVDQKSHETAVVDSAYRQQTLTAIKLLEPHRDEKDIRLSLDICSGNFKKTRALLKRAREIAEAPDIEVADVISYIRQYDNDIERGIAVLLQEIKWEREHTGTHGGYIQLAAKDSSARNLVPVEEKKMR
eukprot:Lankesteria_metandrocarpae@DN4578_c0_g1_i5.p1